MTRSKVVTLLTDYGLDDELVGVCRGVIKRIALAADVIDITHGIAPQRVVRGALLLADTVNRGSAARLLATVVGQEVTLAGGKE